MEKQSFYFFQNVWNTFFSTFIQNLQKVPLWPKFMFYSWKLAWSSQNTEKRSLFRILWNGYKKCSGKVISKKLCYFWVFWILRFFPLLRTYNFCRNIFWAQFNEFIISLKFCIVWYPMIKFVKIFFGWSHLHYLLILKTYAQNGPFSNI
jgi:hypothetical protein